jgi:hypothetical protein
MTKPKKPRKQVAAKVRKATRKAATALTVPGY